MLLISNSLFTVGAETFEGYVRFVDYKIHRRGQKIALKRQVVDAATLLAVEMGVSINYTIETRILLIYIKLQRDAVMHKQFHRVINRRLRQGWNFGQQTAIDFVCRRMISAGQKVIHYRYSLYRRSDTIVCQIFMRLFRHF